MDKPDFTKMLQDALSEPGKISQAYSIFHNYSLSNAWLALWECAIRGIEPGPINTYKGWLQLNRHVRKGEKAIRLIMPVTCKVDAANEAGEKDSESRSFTRFILRPNWFVLSQTEGEETQFPAMPDWDEKLALSTLQIERVPFTHPDGNMQGYAQAGRKIAVSPIAALPHETLFHEMAHILLGHCELGTITDTRVLNRSLREVEAESVAYLVTASLSLEGLEYSRGYIQAWLQGAEVPAKSVQHIFRVANQILKAGVRKMDA